MSRPTLTFKPQKGANYKNNYKDIVGQLNSYAYYNNIVDFGLTCRDLCKTDLFFLLYFVLGRKDVNHPWIVDRIREVEELHEDTLDLWSREHYKTGILTYGLVIQELLKNPEERICIFSHTNKIAKAFLHSIKTTFEINDLLKVLFPDVLYPKPDSQSPKWSLDEGIIIRRQGVYHEASVEACGLVDGMPTGKHYTIRVYDDVVTQASVSTPEQLKKVSDAFVLSQFLKARGGKVRVVGTRYHFADTYSEMKQSGSWTVRERVGIVDGKPVLMTVDELVDFKKRVCQGNTYIYNCQMLLDPVAEELQTFKHMWVKYYRELPRGALNLFLLVDPASSRKTQGSGSDYTVMWLWGLDPLGNYFLVDMIRGRFNLTERWRELKDFLKRWPNIRKVGYEQYGMQADIEHFQTMMLIDGIYFTIEPLGGKLRKEDRIRRLIPLFENGKVYLPESLYKDNIDLVKTFVEEELILFPFAPHDDMLDAAARVLDEDFEAYRPMVFPVESDEDEDRESNVINISQWGRAKANSRYANV